MPTVRRPRRAEPARPPVLTSTNVCSFSWHHGGVAGGMGRSGPTMAERVGATLNRPADDDAATEATTGGRPPVRPVGHDGAVRYQKSRNDCSSGGGPIGLAVAQLGPEPVRRGARAVAVFTWVPWTDGQYHAVKAFAGEWTSSAVHLRWRESTEGLRDVWVWAAWCAGGSSTSPSVREQVPRARLRPPRLSTPQHAADFVFDSSSVCPR